MQKKRDSESGFFNLRIFLGVVLGACASLLAVLSFAGAPARVAGPSRLPDQTAALAKVAPWVMQHTANGQEAEFLVILNDQADLKAARTAVSKKAKSSVVRQALWNKAQTTQGSVLQWLRQRNIEHRSFYIVNAILVKASAEVAQTLAARSDVARVEGNPQIRNVPLPEPETNSPAAPQAPEAIEPGITHTRAPEVWALGYTGQGIVVAGADTGIKWDHTALKPHYRGWDGTTSDHNYNWHDSIHSGGGSCGPNTTAPCDDNSHGSHTIGTAIGSDGGVNQIGMAPGAKFIGCRNMNEGVGTPASYMECMEFFLAPYPLGGTPAQGDPDKSPDITNNSWGCPTDEGCSATTLQAAVEAQRAAGIMMVVSAGNGGPACSTVSDPPGIYDAVYSIGALNTGADTIASFSSRGPVTTDSSLRMKPDISAPGTNTRSCTPTSTTTYGNKSGTSMASPHVAGAVALLWSAQPQLRNDPVATENILNSAAVHLTGSLCDLPTATPNNTFGSGRLDIKTAVDLALTRITDISASGSDMVITFNAIAGHTYRLERATELAEDTDWQSVAGVADLTPGATGSAQFTDVGGANLGRAFYRVGLLP